MNPTPAKPESRPRSRPPTAPACVLQADRAVDSGSPLDAAWGGQHGTGVSSGDGHANGFGSGQRDEPDTVAEDAASGTAGDVAEAGALHRDATQAGCVPALDEAQLVRWIERIAEHDEPALSALYDATFSRVYGLVLRILHRTAWVEEVVEDTYFQVWRQALRYDARRGRALAWLLGMARSRAIDALRHERRFDHLSLDTEDAPALPPADLPPPDLWLACSEGQAHLHQALASLSAPSRQVLALAFFRGLSHEEIAAQTALPLGTIKSQIRRALRAMRAVLDPRGLHTTPT